MTRGPGSVVDNAPLAGNRGTPSTTRNFKGGKRLGGL